MENPQHSTFLPILFAQHCQVVPWEQFLRPTIFQKVKSPTCVTAFVTANIWNMEIKYGCTVRVDQKLFMPGFFVRGSLHVSYEPITCPSNFDLSHIWTCVTAFVTFLSYISYGERAVVHCRGQSKGFLAQFFERGSLYVSYEPITRTNNFDLSHIWTCVTAFVTVLSYDSSSAARGSCCTVSVHQKVFLPSFLYEVHCMYHINRLLAQTILI